MNNEEKLKEALLEISKWNDERDWEDEDTTPLALIAIARKALANTKDTGGKKCKAVLWHGPGHQSKTRCQVYGPHKIHKAVYGAYEQEAEWLGDEAFTRVFDEPPEPPEDIIDTEPDTGREECSNCEECDGTKEVTYSGMTDIWILPCPACTGRLIESPPPKEQDSMKPWVKLLNELTGMNIKNQHPTMNGSHNIDHAQLRNIIFELSKLFKAAELSKPKEQDDEAMEDALIKHITSLNTWSINSYVSKITRIAYKNGWKAACKWMGGK